MTVLSAACGLLGLVSAGMVLLRARDAGLVVRVLLPFLLAAVLLRLSADPTWRDLLAAAVLVALHGVAVTVPGAARPGP